MTNELSNTNLEKFKKLESMLLEIKDFHVHVGYLAPCVALLLSHAAFGDVFERMSDDELQDQFIDKLDTACLSPEINNEIKTLLKQLGSENWLQIDFLTLSQFDQRKKMNPNGSSWVYDLLHTSKEVKTSEKPMCIHFYGHKGGQARSTVMSILANEVAKKGWKILVVDADFEAPSCHVFYECNLEFNSTIFAFLEKNSKIEVQRVANPLSAAQGDAGVYLLGSNINSLDTIKYLSHVENLSSSPRLLESLGKKIYQFAKENSFDAIFIDHRTGISNVTLPMIHSLPGKGVLFCRLDNLWRDAELTLDIFLKAVNSFQVICFDPFGISPEQKFILEYREQIEDLKEFLTKPFAAKNSTLQGEDIDLDDIDESEIAPLIHFWQQHNSFKNQKIPAINDIGDKNQTAVEKLLAGLALTEEKKVTKLLLEQMNENLALSSSGAVSGGTFLLTPALKIGLDNTNKSHFFIGRKGSGKTRFLRFFSDQNTGIPIIVDFRTKGIGISNDGYFKDLILLIVQNAKSNETIFSEFWRKCFIAAARANSKDPVAIIAQFKLLENSPINYQQFENELNSLPGNLFLFDSFETTFPPTSLPRFLEALFETLRHIDSHCKSHQFWIFMRKDLLQFCGQNQSQFRDNRTTIIDWNFNQVLNLLCHMMADKKYFDVNSSNKKNQKIIEFENVSLSKKIVDSFLSNTEAFKVLRSVLPSTIETRGNPSLESFLSGYFADSFDTIEAKYNPRFVYFFVNSLPSPPEKDTTNDFRIDSNTVQEAYKKASSEYMEEVLEEVRTISIQESADRDSKSTKKTSLTEEDFNKIVSDFRGCVTPFRKEVFIRDIADKSRKSQEKVRLVYEIFETLGVFYVHESNTSYTRATNLMRSALGMKINNKLGRGVDPVF